MVYSRAAALGNDANQNLMASLLAAGASWLRNPGDETRRVLDTAISEVQRTDVFRKLLALKWNACAVIPVTHPNGSSPDALHCSRIKTSAFTYARYPSPNRKQPRSFTRM
jgi:hypothetical protein